MDKRTWLGVLALLLVAQAGQAAATTIPRGLDLQTVTNAHYNAHHLIGNGIASPSSLRANAQIIESSLRILEVLELTRPVAADYRQSMVKIGEGARDYDEARQSTGKRRSQLVELGNAAMHAAKALLDAAVKIFEQIEPQLVRLFATQQRPPAAHPHEPSPWPIKIISHFRDCLGGKRGSDLECCEDNKRAAEFLIREYGHLWPPTELQEIIDCVDAAYGDCRKTFNGRNQTFSRKRWEDCFKRYFIFIYR